MILIQKQNLIIYAWVKEKISKFKLFKTKISSKHKGIKRKHKKYIIRMFFLVGVKYGHSR